ncbi:isocitrate lyase/PEP mutase family protein [Sphaerisporangium aureirubrum]|uniref:Isocitrate lyase/phosphoenolpyruvate mutase family protein n=1 Tax=Sphaerisporangium aureirubrum TaxID=1544736 RepID=A0ABW1NCH4_9ACTN
MNFHDLHYSGRPLLLPNAWDVPSALVFLADGYPAIGTTSFGVAATCGRPDGARATREANLALARALSALPCPVSVDVEDGYSDDPAEVAAYVAGLEAAGINIEDSTGAGTLVSPWVHAAKITAIKQRCPDLFVNARVDTYWLGRNATVGATLERATRYVEAGADGVFVPGATDPSVLRRLTARLPVPVNVLATPGRSLADLAALGVRRVSTGSLPYRAALHAALETANAVRDGRPTPPATPYADMQAELVRHAEDRRPRAAIADQAG